MSENLNFRLLDFVLVNYNGGASSTTKESWLMISKYLLENLFLIYETKNLWRAYMIVSEWRSTRVIMFLTKTLFQNASKLFFTYEN
jgi:hypothetical protein